MDYCDKLLKMELLAPMGRLALEYKAKLWMHLNEELEFHDQDLLTVSELWTWDSRKRFWNYS